MKQGVPRVTEEPAAGASAKSRPLWIKEIEETLASVLGAEVSVRSTASAAGS